MYPPEKMPPLALPPETPRFSSLHPDIIESHILTRLDGAALASAACCCTTLRQRSSPEYLWSNICRSAWPSTAGISEVIARFPGGGSRAFFSQAFPVLPENCISNSSSAPPPAELLSAVDIHHQGKLIFTKLQVTQTDTDWFRCSPFHIDLLDHKDAVVTVPIGHPDGEMAAVEGVTLSWILVDPIGRRAANISSHSPVASERHWLTGEIQIRFATIVAVAGDQGHLQCGIVVTCGKGMQVKEVKLDIEDMDGKHLTGTESLEIIQGALEGRKRSGIRTAAEARRRYGEFEEMKRERRERKERREGVLDALCVAFGALIFSAFLLVLICM